MTDRLIKQLDEKIDMVQGELNALQEKHFKEQAPLRDLLLLLGETRQRLMMGPDGNIPAPVGKQELEVLQRENERLRNELRRKGDDPLL